MPRTRLLIIQPTPFCNINCNYCYLPGRSSKAVIEYATLWNLLSQLFASGWLKNRLEVVWHADRVVEGDHQSLLTTNRPPWTAEDGRWRIGFVSQKWNFRASENAATEQTAAESAKIGMRFSAPSGVPLPGEELLTGYRLRPT